MAPFNTLPEGFSAASLQLLDQGLNQIWSDMQIAAEAQSAAKSKSASEANSHGAPADLGADCGAHGLQLALEPAFATGRMASVRGARAGRGRAGQAGAHVNDALNSHNRSAWMSQQTQHKYKVGQEVSFSPAKLSMPASSRSYKIMSRLPREGGEYMYRIKSAAELFERVARESEIVRFSSAGDKGGM